MQIEVKEIEPCKLSVNYIADSEELDSKKIEVLNYFKKAPVPGFRKGKSTIDVIKSYYKNQIDDSLKKAMLEEAFHQTLFKEKFKPHGQPQFTLVKLKDESFSCSFDIRTRPNFDIPEYLNLEIPSPHIDEDELSVSEKMLQELRKRFGETISFTEDDVVGFGDSVIIDYEGFYDGQKIDSISVEGEMVTVGNSHFKDFDQNILGMKASEVREFDLTVPENGLPSLAGKVVQMKVSLTTGSKNVPCALDDSLAKKLGKSSFDALKAAVRQTATSSIQSKQKKLILDAVSSKLVDLSLINVPDWMTLSEAEYVAASAKVDWQSLPDVDKSKYLDFAERNVKLSLLLEAIREVEPEAELSRNEVIDLIRRNLEMTKLDKPIEEVMKQMDQSGYSQVLFAKIRDEYTLDFISKSVKFID